MGYAQKVDSPRGSARNYFLARYKQANGKYGTVKGTDGKPAHYERKRDAKKAADSAEAAVREGRARQAEAEVAVILFRQWARTWYNSLRLAPSTMLSYKEHLELHIQPAFGDLPMSDKGFLPLHVEQWRQQLREDGYKESSIGTFQGTLRVCLADAVPSLLSFNPAASGSKAGRGKRGVGRAATGRASAEKVITSLLGAILTAERTAVLSGRDDEFVLAVTLMTAGLRLGEGIGLEASYAPPHYAGGGLLRVEWQLSEVGRTLYRAIPKYGSRGDVVVPPFLSGLIGSHLAEHPPAPCACHGLAYAFTAPGVVRHKPAPGGVTVRDVAAAAGVGAETVWAALADDGRVPQAVRLKVRAAAAGLGWTTGAAPVDPGWHWVQAGFRRLFTAAATGWYRGEGVRSAARPVYLTGEWPGAAELKRLTAKRQPDWCWLPVAPGLTPHSLRHSLRTWMEENGIPHVLAESQLRHERQDTYRHVSDGMRADYRGRFQEAWETALGRRGELSDGSPVRVLDGLLREAENGFLARNSQTGNVTALRARA